MSFTALLKAIWDIPAPRKEDNSPLGDYYWPERASHCHKLLIARCKAYNGSNQWLDLFIRVDNTLSPDEYTLHWEGACYRLMRSLDPSGDRLWINRNTHDWPFEEEVVI